MLEGSAQRWKQLLLLQVARAPLAGPGKQRQATCARAADAGPPRVSVGRRPWPPAAANRAAGSQLHPILGPAL